MGLPRPHLLDSGHLPTPAEARLLAQDLLGSEGTRWPHVRTAGTVARSLGRLFADDQARALEVAATLHDIGYSRRIARTGFHPLDGAHFLRAQGFSEVLVRLVANHSLASVTATGTHRAELREQFPAAPGLLSDALAYADMHSAPDGRLTVVEHRLADIAVRHRDRAQTQRARGLRLAVARVEQALTALPTEVRQPGAADLPSPESRSA